ncbi:MAG: hypothetical protein WC299_11200, partial [Kiritimatiellia bacterium]
MIASSDDHATLPGSVHHFRLLPFREPDLNGFAHKGLAAIRCPALTRKDLFEAIMRRSVYATTQDLSLLEFGIGGAGMGQEIKADSSLRQKRQIRLCFTLHGADYARVILMRNGVEFESRAARGPNLMT